MTFHCVIEVFAVELWREIFEYFNPNELWYSFRGLNKRIDAIIDQTQLHLDFNKKDSYKYFVKTILPTINLINVQSLKLQEFVETRHFFSRYSLNSLSQLRVLSLNPMYSFNDDKFIFWKQLLSLKHLRLLKILFRVNLNPNNLIEEKEFIIRSIFNNDYCPLLESFSISTCGRQRWEAEIPSLIPTTESTKIKHLSIDSLTFNDLIKLLPALKNIRIFRIHYKLAYVKQSNEQLQNMTIITPLLPNCLKMGLTLSDDMMFEHVEYILKQTPCLKDLFLWGWDHLLDAKRWELLLSVQCPKLVKLELICTGHICDENFVQAIHNFEEACKTSPFWLERNITMNDDDRSGHDYRSDITIQFNIEKSKQSIGYK